MSVTLDSHESVGSRQERGTQDLVDESVNPLLSALPAHMKRPEIEAWLGGGKRREVVDPSQVRGWIEDGLVITKTAVDVASSMIKMMRRSAHDQDPRILENRKRAMDDQLYTGCRPLTASGLCISGDTGVGKSHIVQHVLQRIPQVIVHGPNEEAKMLELVQLVHLTIQLSGDGTPSAFYLNALRDIDRVLGTDYEQSFASKGRSSRTSAMSYFMHQVKKHRVLLLVIEEGQEKNLGHRKFRRALDDLVIQFMNFGVPVVVLGNPLGIDLLKRESQAQRRLCSNGDFRIDPSIEWNGQIWRTQYIQGIWCPSPLPEADEGWCSSDALAQLLWQATGGFPGLLAQLREITVCNAMERDAVRVSREDLLLALGSEAYAGSLAIAEPFVTRNAGLLSTRFKDVKASHYADAWEALKRANASAAAELHVQQDVAPTESEATLGEQSATTASIKPSAQQSAPKKGG